jgi:hypothetical protein
MLKRALALAPALVLVAASSEALAGTVGEAVANSCTTTSVKALSEQIVAQANCISPGAFVPLDDAPNLVLGSAVFPYLEAPAKDALMAALGANPGTTLTVNSMLRTVAQQYLLYTWYKTGQCGIGLAATPGASNHETGLAMDVSEYGTWDNILDNYGFAWFGAADPVHFDYVGAGAVDYKGTDVLAFQKLWNLNHPNDVIAEDGAYGPQTESRLVASPAEGFALVPDCGDGPKPDLTIALDFPDASDDLTDGASAGTIDLYEGETRTLTLTVKNTGQAAADAVTIALELATPFLGATTYLIESDWGHPGTFAENSANGSAANPPHDADVGSSARFELDAFSPGETKRVTLGLDAVSYSLAKDALSDVRFWVVDVPGYYHRDTFEGPADNVGGSQTFQGGELALSRGVDVFAAARWEWDTDRREGWEPVGGASATLDTSSGELVLDGAEKTEGLERTGLSIDAATIRGLTLEAARDGGGSAVRVLFVTEDDGSWGGTKSVTATLPDGDGSSTLTFDLASAAAWKGTVTGLRLLPFDSGGTLRFARAELTGEGAASSSSGDYLNPWQSGDEAASADGGCALVSGPARRDSAPILAALGLTLLALARRRPRGTGTPSGRKKIQV